MRTMIGVRMALIGLSGLVLAGCAGLPSLPIPNFGSGSGGDDVEDPDKAGRIALTIDAEELEADPEMASVAIILPDPVTRKNWTQAGATASKVTGHVAAAREFKVAWRSNGAAGSNRTGALTTAPVASEDRIYVLDAEQTVRAFNIENGRRLWSSRLRSRSRRDRATVGGGIAINADKAIVASGYGFVVALDLETGDEVWRRETNAPMTGSPTIKDGRAFVASQNNEIIALNIETGAVEWSDQAIAETARVLASPSPAAIQDIVVAPYSSGEVIAYLSSNGRRLWTDALTASGRFTPISSINDIPARPVLSNGLVYASSQSGVTAAIDGRSGQRVWTQTIGSVQAPNVVGEFVYVAGVDGKVACMDRNTGTVVWVTQLPEFENRRRKRGKISYSGPIIASNRVVVVSSTGDLIGLSPQTGEEEERLRLGGSIFLEPISVGDKLFVLNDNGRLIAVR